MPAIRFNIGNIDRLDLAERAIGLQVRGLLAFDRGRRNKADISISRIF
jgi:hypothetical protein